MVSNLQPDEIVRLLEKAGFTDIKFHKQITPESLRNQDLGMMAKRMIISAVVRKEWTQLKGRRSEVKNITVIFGDPQKPDALKPSNVFDDDDFYTIDKLKEALRQIKGYNFTYLNNHNTLINDLMTF